MKVLHSICQQIWKTQQWPQDLKRSVCIPIPKKGNAKECSNYQTILLISHASTEKAMATHSSTVAWKIPWPEEPGRLQSMGSRRVAHDWATSLSLFTFRHWRRKMATHSSVLAWRIPGMGEPGGLQSMGLHRAGHDWSNLAAAAAAHASKVMQKILQARLQQYVNRELPDVHAGFRKCRGTRDQIANICWIIEKAWEFQKNIYFCFIKYVKAFDCVDHKKLWKFFKKWEYETTWPASWEICM